METPLRSGLYRCEAVHERIHPKRHGFRYRILFFDFDLDETPDLHRRLRWFSLERFNLFSLCRRDHLDYGEASIRGNIEAYLRREGISLPEGARIRLITLPRILGYVFNPVSFFFVVDPDGRPLHAIAEVGNTFLEQKPFLLASPDAGGVFRLRAPKHFYVSPFTSLTAEFDFRIRIPDERIEIHIDDVENGRTTLVSWIRGRRSPLNDRSLLWHTFRYPLLTLQVILKIHWQAFLLWRKKIPYFKKSGSPHLQRNVHRPHKSLTQNQDR